MIGLDRLARAVGAAVVGGDRSRDARGVAVVDVEHDSRLVRPGALFACIRGASHDGHDFAGQAVGRGAAALLVQAPVPGPVPSLVVPSVRAALGPAAAEVHGHPSRRLELVGVTGTDGKTTTVRLLAGILNAVGRPADEMGTLTGARTTPEATEIQRRLARSVADGRRVAVMEVSSHALAQHRVGGCRFRIAAFTNLGRDHLDYHGTVDAYLRAKALLFEPDLSDRAVVWTGSAGGRQLAAAAAVPVTEVGPGDVQVLELKPGSTRFRWRGLPVEIKLGGRFNVHNAVLAAEAAVALGVDPAAAAGALAAAGPAPGRFEIVDAGQDFTVVVDYAHTPDALRAALDAAREITARRLWAVFGAGGERDPDKRPVMGAVAAAAADRAVVTSDNPRGEDPARIISEIVSGMDRLPHLVVTDRRLAIRRALAEAAPGDVIVIAGKGHEATQTVGSETVEFDDRLVARAELARLAGAGPAGGEAARAGAAPEGRAPEERAVEGKAMEAAVSETTAGER